MKTSLIRFAKGASPREPYGTLTPISRHEDGEKGTVSLVNHDVQITLEDGKSVEWSGLIEVLNTCVCIVTWSREAI